MTKKRQVGDSSGSGPTTLAMATRRPYIAWRLTKRCNLRCPTCFFSDEARAEDEETVSAELLTRFLAATGRRWRVGLSGGEPLLHRRLLELCEALVPEHQIEMNTNFSSRRRLEAFASVVPPSSVPKLVVGVHYAVREQAGLIGNFIDNYRFMAAAGYNLEAVYLIYPGVHDRFDRDRDHLARHGVEVVPKPFRGVQDGQEYPYAFDEAYRAIFALVPASARRLVYDFRGVPCRAGIDVMRIENDLTVRRCGEAPVRDRRMNRASHSDETMPCADPTEIGRVDAGVHFADEPQPCRSPRCTCFGRHYAEVQPHERRFMNGMRAFMINDYDAASRHFEATHAAEPRHAAALNNLAVIRQIRGDHGRAATLLAAAAELAPEDDTIRENRRILADRQRRECRLAMRVRPPR